MKKFLIAVIVIALLIVGYGYDQFGWCKKLLFGSPTTHVIQKGEYLSEIAKKYYGRADYWRELALINRAPDSDLVFPGEEIIIPSLDVIKEIRRTRWLSKVNAYVKNEEDVIAGLNQGDEPVLAETEPKTTPETMLDSEQQELTSAPGVADAPIETAQQSFESDQPEVRSASSIGLILAIIGVLFVGSLTALILIRRKKRSQQIRIVDNDEINILDDEETEPDYQEYLQKNKSKREEGVLVN